MKKAGAIYRPAAVYESIFPLLSITVINSDISAPQMHPSLLFEKQKALACWRTPFDDDTITYLFATHNVTFSLNSVSLRCFLRYTSLVFVHTLQTPPCSPSRLARILSISAGQHSPRRHPEYRIESISFSAKAYFSPKTLFHSVLFDIAI